MLDSDTDNSIIIENNRNKKLPCLKDTPLKIDSGHKNPDISMEYGNNDETTSLGDETESDISGEISDDEDCNDKVSSDTNSEVDDNVRDKADAVDTADENNDSINSYNNQKPIKKNNRHRFKFSDSENSLDENNAFKSDNTSRKSLPGTNSDSSDDESENIKIFGSVRKNRKKIISSDSSSNDNTPDKRSQKANNSMKSISKLHEVHENVIVSDKDIKESCDLDDDNNKLDDESDDGPDEDLMVMSRATRLSIMGVAPKGIDSDESDFIESDSVRHICILLLSVLLKRINLK